MSKAMLIDTSKCLNCSACSVECKRRNQVPVGQNIFYTRMLTFEKGEYPAVKAYFIKKACNHCTQAVCVDVCPTHALAHHPDGYVTLDQEKCNGCGYCSQYCPFGVPQLQIVNAFTGAAKANKCTFCVDRLAEGLPTACASACPFGAISFGEREALLEQGKARVAVLQSQGKPAARLYGENELGGLHVLYVLEDVPSAYGLPDAPKYPALNTVRTVVGGAGGAALGLAIVGLALNWLSARGKIHAEEKFVGEQTDDK
jgi:formate dehydrogenase iron-sulfur subunit